MTVEFEFVTLIDAPPTRVFELSLDVELHSRSMADSHERAVGGVTTGLLGPGESVTWRGRHFGIPWTMTSRIVEFEQPNFFVDEQVRGPFARFRHEHVFGPAGSGTRMVDRVAFDAPCGPFGDAVERVVLGGYLKNLVRQRNRFLKQRAESPD